MEIKKNVMVEWRDINNKHCLFFLFNGTLTTASALEAIEKWKEAFTTRKNEKITIIWHCIEMKGYEPLARSAWQKTIKELKDQIDLIWLITDSPVIMAGAKVISIFTSFDIKVVKTEKELTLTMLK